VLDQQLDQQASLLFLRHKANTLLNQLRRLLFWNDRNADWVVQDGVREISNLRLHRRRKHQCLTLARHMLEDPTNGRKEAHVQHAVRFVKDERVQAFQMNIALFNQVQQTSGCGHNHIDAFAKSTHLRLLSNSAIDRGNSNGGKGSVVRKAFVNLNSQFASTRENQHANLARSTFRGRSGIQ
jgi:hypothetical protein